MTILTRRLLAVGVAGSVLLGAGSLALAQNPTAPKAPGTKAGRPGKRPARANRMQALNLTNDQKAKIKALRADFNQRYLAILTPEQRKTWEANRRQRNGARRRGPNARSGRPGGKGPMGKANPGTPPG